MFGQSRLPFAGASGRTDDGGRYRRISPLDVRLEDVDELVDEPLAAERPVEPAVDEDRGQGILERPGQRDPDVGVLALAGTVDDAAHHRDAHLLDTRPRRLPLRHPVLEMSLDLL